MEESMSSIPGIGGVGGTAPTTATETDPSAVTVRLGETKLSEVAERVGVSTQDLLDANPQIQDPNHLSAGQELHFPSRRSEDALVKHSAEGTDTEAVAPPGGS